VVFSKQHPPLNKSRPYDGPSAPHRLVKSLSYKGFNDNLPTNNRAALREAQQLVPPDATLESFDLDGIPPFNQDEEQQPPVKVVELKTRVRAADAILRVRAADAILFVTPEYNYSNPGVLKNAIDWASRPYGDNAWESKPVALMSASAGRLGTARAQYHLRQVFIFLNITGATKLTAGASYEGCHSLRGEKTVHVGPTAYTVFHTTTALVSRCRQPA
jgi:NAD(P)H-dependent FMN reductase